MCWNTRFCLWPSHMFFVDHESKAIIPDHHSKDETLPSASQKLNFSFVVVKLLAGVLYGIPLLNVGMTTSQPSTCSDLNLNWVLERL